MLTRVKQVIAALTAKVGAAERRFVGENLTGEERELFYAMNLPDQRHALNVAYTVLKLADAWPQADKTLLLKCALLHDIGKIRGDVSTGDKIITVLAHKLVPKAAKRWGKYGRGGRWANLRHAFYIYFNHPARGADLLAAIGAKRQVIDIVRRHHDKPAADDPPELAVLRQADNLH